MTPRCIVYTLGLSALAASVRELHTVPQHIDAPVPPLPPPFSSPSACLPFFCLCFLPTLRGCVPCCYHDCRRDVSHVVRQGSVFICVGGEV